MLLKLEHLVLTVVIILYFIFTFILSFRNNQNETQLKRNYQKFTLTQHSEENFNAVSRKGSGSKFRGEECYCYWEFWQFKKGLYSHSSWWSALINHWDHVYNVPSSAILFGQGDRWWVVFFPQLFRQPKIYHSWSNLYSLGHCTTHFHLAQECCTRRYCSFQKVHSNPLPSFLLSWRRK